MYGIMAGSLQPSKNRMQPSQYRKKNKREGRRGGREGREGRESYRDNRKMSELCLVFTQKDDFPGAVGTGSNPLANVKEKAAVTQTPSAL